MRKVKKDELRAEYSRPSLGKGVRGKYLKDYGRGTSFESDPRFIARIESLRQNYQREGGTSLDDVRKELGLTKRRRRKK